MRKLTTAQQRALDKLNNQYYLSAYDIKERLSTLNALSDRGLVEKRYEPGYMAFPRNCILFKKPIKNN